MLSYRISFHMVMLTHKGQGQKWLNLQTAWIQMRWLIVMMLTLNSPSTKIAEFANSIGTDEVAHDELPHLGLICLP